ncbi:MAG TPA: thymidylate synthase [Planctomycetota bacterium]|jgi:hypothetical protein
MASDWFIPSSTNLSVAWAQAFLRLMEPGIDELTPLIVRVHAFDNGTAIENDAIRERLDKELERFERAKCHTVANTIFPISLWNPSLDDGGAHVLGRYGRIWAMIKKCPANKYGVYFRRLTAYQPEDSVLKPVDQLTHIVDTYRSGNHRRSALIASVFDPTRDHSNNRQLGFPCLQQVNFAPVGQDGLCVTGFYATQFFFERAYGNYLGLCRLGKFMAARMGLRLTQLTCVASVGARGRRSKEDLQDFATDLRAILRSQETTA